jgi:hypothetical protein
VLHDGQPGAQATTTYPCIHLAVQWLKRLDADLLPQKPMFDPKQVHVGFVVEKVAIGQVSFGVFQFSPVSTIPPKLQTLFHSYTFNMVDKRNYSAL